MALLFCQYHGVILLPQWQCCLATDADKTLGTHRSCYRCCWIPSYSDEEGWVQLLNRKFEECCVASDVVAMLPLNLCHNGTGGLMKRKQIDRRGVLGWSALRMRIAQWHKYRGFSLLKICGNLSRRLLFAARHLNPAKWQTSEKHWPGYYYIYIYIHAWILWSHLRDKRDQRFFVICFGKRCPKTIKVESEKAKVIRKRQSPEKVCERRFGIQIRQRSHRGNYGNTSCTVFPINCCTWTDSCQNHAMGVGSLLSRQLFIPHSR
jgi:hypothetical protein